MIGYFFNTGDGSIMDWVIERTLEMGLGGGNWLSFRFGVEGFFCGVTFFVFWSFLVLSPPK